VGRDRFRSVGALAPQDGWKAELALDRGRSPPRPVELAEVGREVASDGVALAALLRACELATRVVHPAVLPVQGLVERGGGMALASAHHPGVALPELLAAGGPLAPPLAIRVAGQVARALEAIHGLTTPGERPLVHGAIGPEAVRIGLAGEVLLVGLGRPSAAGPVDDVAALVALLGRLDPDPPAEVAAALGELTGGEASAGALWRALEAAVAPAEPAQLALWLERMAPEALAAAQARERSVAQAVEEEGSAPAAEPQRPASTPPPRPAPIAGCAMPPSSPAGGPGQAAPLVPAGPAVAAPIAGPSVPEPDWFAPPAASPPPLKGVPPRAGPRPPAVPTAPLAPGAPPVLERGVGVFDHLGQGASIPDLPRLPAAPDAFLERLGDDRLRAPIAAVAALLGLVLGWLGGR